jgi:hypothetical protein
MKLPHLRQFLHLAAGAAAATFGSIAWVTAQDAGDVPAVATARAPFHLPAFQNEYVTVFNVHIPPGRNTGYHVHTLDMVTVVVEDPWDVPKSQRKGQQGCHRPAEN